jgi:phospholipid/cholesterol/gamma-HCH transport system permease protein
MEVQVEVRVQLGPFPGEAVRDCASASAAARPLSSTEVPVTMIVWTPASRERASTASRSSRNEECVRLAPMSASVMRRAVYSRAMIASDAELSVETVENDPVPTRVRASGEWTFAGLKTRREEILRTLDDLRGIPPSRVAWDLTPIADLDDTGALWLARAMRGVFQLEASGQQREILDRVAQGSRVRIAMEHPIDPYAPVVAIGEAALHFGAHLRDATALLGRVVLEAGALARRPRDTPLRELSASVYRAGVAALPVTMLVGFLVGIVLTYLSALQLKRYGADLLVINIVGVGVVRELGPMLASIIAAGRSGSAMTAQLGVMRVTEEIEALQVMGVSIITRLVLPKVIALAIALPLVAFCTDLAALAGALLVSRFTLGIPPQAFLEALPRAVEPVNFWIGIGKSGAFGFVVAFVACHYGLKVLPNTDSLAAGVTRSVVASITCVIILDAIFAILLRNVG